MWPQTRTARCALGVGMKRKCKSASLHCRMLSSKPLCRQGEQAREGFTEGGCETHLRTTTANSSMPVSEFAHVDWSTRAAQSRVSPWAAGFSIVTTPEELCPTGISICVPVNRCVQGRTGRQGCRLVNLLASI